MKPFLAEEYKDVTFVNWEVVLTVGPRQVRNKCTNGPKWSRKGPFVHSQVLITGKTNLRTTVVSNGQHTQKTTLEYPKQNIEQKFR